MPGVGRKRALASLARSVEHGSARPFRGQRSDTSSMETVNAGPESEGQNCSERIETVTMLSKPFLVCKIRLKKDVEHRAGVQRMFAFVSSRWWAGLCKACSAFCSTTWGTGRWSGCCGISCCHYRDGTDYLCPSLKRMHQGSPQHLLQLPDAVEEEDEAELP